MREKIYGKDYKEYYGGSITGIPSEEFEKLNVQTKIKLRDELRAVEQAGRTVLSGSIVGNEKDLDAFSREMQELSLKTQKSRDKIQTKINKIENLNLEKSKEITKAINENRTTSEEWSNYFDKQGEMRKALSDKIGAENEINQQARSNLIAQVEEAKNKVSEIYSQENPDLNAVGKSHFNFKRSTNFRRRC